MISLHTVIGLLLTHLVADFFLQSNWMALNKSKSWKALLAHTYVYSACFLPYFGLEFALITWATHTVTDAITSRITSKLWFINLLDRSKWEREEEYDPNYFGAYPNYFGAYPFFAYVEQGKRHWFYVMIGVDQTIHYVTLLLTYVYLAG